MAKKAKRKAAPGDVATNRQASYRYEFLERLETGMVLQGTEVKSLRDGGAQLKDGYATIRDGELWRLVTSGFLHGGLFHLLANMLALYILGQMIEPALGRLRFALLYFVALLCGSFGALLLSPDSLTVGASGAVFGLLGAAAIIARSRGISLMESGLGLWIGINLLITFTIPGISIGGHLGGLAGGALAMLALSRFGRTHAVYGRPGIVGIGGVVAVAVLSLGLAYWRVESFV